MAYGEAKVYFDGSHYIAIPHTTRPTRRRYSYAEEEVLVAGEGNENKKESTLSNGESVPFGMKEINIDEIERKIGYEFKDKMLLRKCFTHSSYANENGGENNELLEFFGDAIIQYVVTEFLYKFAEGDEGKLTEKLYSSVYEALVAGIYLDGGMVAVKRFVKRTIIEDYVEKCVSDKKQVKTDFKTLIQEFVQKKKIGTITYQTLGKEGPDHKPIFREGLLLNGNLIAEGRGNSKKQAQNESAFIALGLLKEQEGRRN